VSFEFIYQHANFGEFRTIGKLYFVFSISDHWKLVGKVFGKSLCIGNRPSPDDPQSDIAPIWPARPTGQFPSAGARPSEQRSRRTPTVPMVRRPSHALFWPVTTVRMTPRLYLFSHGIDEARYFLPHCRSYPPGAEGRSRPQPFVRSAPRATAAATKVPPPAPASSQPCAPSPPQAAAQSGLAIRRLFFLHLRDSCPPQRRQRLPVIGRLGSQSGAASSSTSLVATPRCSPAWPSAPPTAPRPSTDSSTPPRAAIHGELPLAPMPKSGSTHHRLASVTFPASLSPPVAGDWPEPPPGRHGDASPVSWLGWPEWSPKEQCSLFFSRIWLGWLESGPHQQFPLGIFGWISKINSIELNF
jgi:hypothetical protein